MRCLGQAMPLDDGRALGDALDNVKATLTGIRRGPMGKPVLTKPKRTPHTFFYYFSILTSTSSRHLLSPCSTYPEDCS